MKTLKKSPQEEINKEIGEKIKSMRRSLRGSLSARQVAEKLKISRVKLTQVENGKRNISAFLVWEIACVLGCDIKDLFPPTPAGFQIRERDFEEVRKVDKKAVGWAEELFGETDKKI